MNLLPNLASIPTEAWLLAIPGLLTFAYQLIQVFVNRSKAKAEVSKSKAEEDRTKVDAANLVVASAIAFNERLEKRLDEVEGALALEITKRAVLEREQEQEIDQLRQDHRKELASLEQRWERERSKLLDDIEACYKELRELLEEAKNDNSTND